MAYSTLYRRCIFCGDRANSREHAIPKCMSKRLGIKVQMSVFSGNVTSRKQPVSFASHRARIFCQPCNAHFKHLEDAVIPLFVPMAKGRLIVLGKESQELLSLWASKTTMALIAAGPPELREIVPLEHRRVVREQGIPPPNTWVAFIPWRGDPQGFVAGSTLDQYGMGPDLSCETYTVVFAAAQIAFKVVGMIDPLPAKHIIDGDRRGICQFWPPLTNLISWPPDGLAATGADMPRLISFAPVRRTV